MLAGDAIPASGARALSLYGVAATVRAPALAAVPPHEASPQSPTNLPYGYGFLTVAYAKPAEVYIQGKRAGATNERLKVRCGASLSSVGVARKSSVPGVADGRGNGDRSVPSGDPG